MTKPLCKQLWLGPPLANVIIKPLQTSLAVEEDSEKYKTPKAVACRQQTRKLKKGVGLCIKPISGGENQNDATRSQYQVIQNTNVDVDKKGEKILRSLHKQFL